MASLIGRAQIVACPTSAQGHQCSSRLAGFGASCRPSRKRMQCRLVSCCDPVSTEHSKQQTPPASVARRHVLLSMTTAVVGHELGAPPVVLANDETLQASVVHSDQEWRQLLTPGQYSVLRKAGTELPFSSPLNKEYREGTFQCAGCGSNVFSSSAKFNSGTGWPSFYQALPDAVRETQDYSIPFLPRTEITCRTCGGHLGHVFNDGPPPTGLRYCMNGVAMSFTAASATAASA